MTTRWVYITWLTRHFPHFHLHSQSEDKSMLCRFHSPVDLCDPTWVKSRPKKKRRSSAFQDHTNFRCDASSKHSKPERRQQSLKLLRPVSRSVWYERGKKNPKIPAVLTALHTHTHQISTASRAMNLLQPFPCIHGAWSSKPSTWVFRQTWMKKTGGVERCLDLLDLWPYDDGVVFAYLLLPVLLVVEGTVVLVRVPMKTAVQPSTPTLEPCNRHTPCSQRTVAPVGVHN